MLFSLFGGVFADRKDRRKMLLVSQYIQMTCAFLLAILFFTHTVRIWHILTLSFVVGLGSPLADPHIRHCCQPSWVQKTSLTLSP